MNNSCAVFFFFKFTVKALKEIAKTLGKKDWNFNVDPCSKEKSWHPEAQVKGSENKVGCDCSFSNATVCHVVSMYILSFALFLLH